MSGTPTRRTALYLAAGVVVAGAVVWIGLYVLGRSEGCSRSTNGYVVELCISHVRATADGAHDVAVSVEVDSSTVDVERVDVYMNGERTISLPHPPYLWSHPSFLFGNKSTRLEVEAVMNDGYRSPPLAVEVPSAPPTGGDPPVESLAPDRDLRQGEIVAVVGGGGVSGEPSTRLAETIAAQQPSVLVHLGEPEGHLTPVEYWNRYAQQGWKRFDSVLTLPPWGEDVPESSSGSGWGAPAPSQLPVGKWSFVFLDPDCGAADRCGEMIEELAESGDGECNALFVSRGLRPDGEGWLASVWDSVVEGGVDLVVAGGDGYQRWAPVGVSGSADPSGVPQIVVGAAGIPGEPLEGDDERLVVVEDGAESGGALLLQPNPQGVSFALIEASGAVRDAGVAPCRGTSDTSPPTAPSDLQVDPGSGTDRVALSWSASVDDRGVVGYEIRRNGRLTETASWTEKSASVEEEAPHMVEYSVVALDGAGNRSTPATHVPAGSEPRYSVLFPRADTFVSSKEPRSNFGKGPHLRVDGDPSMRTLIRFDVPDSALPIRSALLRLKHGSPSSAGVTVSSVSSRWREESVAFVDQPEVRGATTVRGSPSETGEWMEIDVTELVTVAGPVAFAVDQLSPGASQFMSRHTAGSPELIIESGSPEPGDLETGIRLVAVDDGSVGAGAPSVDDVNLRVDGDPAVNAYVTFDLVNWRGPIGSATLRVYAQSSSGEGLEVYTAEAGWEEEDLSESDPPPFDRTVTASSGPVWSGKWIEFDVTGTLDGGNRVAFMIGTNGGQAVTLSAREGGHPPELVLVP